MLSKNLVLRKRYYSCGDTEIKTDSKIRLGKSKIKLMEKNFFRVLDYVESIFETNIAMIDLETSEESLFGEQMLVFRNNENDDFIVFYFRSIGIFTKCNKGKILKNGYEFPITNDDVYNDMDEGFLAELSNLFIEVKRLFERNEMLETA